MKRTSALLGFCFACLSTASAAIDFTPTKGEREINGVVFPQLVFRENGRNIIYEPPRTWTPSGGGASIKFIPPKILLAEGELQQQPLKAPLTFDEPTTKALQAQTVALAPSGSTNVTIVGEEKNPILVNGNATYEVTVAYNFYGEEFQLSMLYVSLPETLLKMRTLAKKTDFEKVHSAFRASAVSFQGLKPGNG